MCVLLLCVYAVYEIKYRIAGKFGEGIKFGALADRPTDRQIKNPPIFNTRIYVRTYIRIRVYGIDTWPAGPPTREAQPHNNGCGRSRTSA